MYKSVIQNKSVNQNHDEKAFSPKTNLDCLKAIGRVNNF